MAVYQWLVRHSVMTILITIWALALTTWVTYRVFGDNPPEVSGGTAAAFATLFALPVLAVGLWKWRRGLDYGFTDKDRGG